MKRQIQETSVVSFGPGEIEELLRKKCGAPPGSKVEMQIRYDEDDENIGGRHIARAYVVGAEVRWDSKEKK